MTSQLPPAELFAQIAHRHGHRCPMSTLGGRLGFAARRRLPAGAVRGIYFADTCAVDGVLAAAGCSRQDGSLQMHDEGRHALVLLSDPAAAVAVELRPRALEIAGEYRRSSAALERDRASLGRAALATRQAQCEAVLEEVIARLRTLEEGVLVEVSPVAEARRRTLWEALHA